MGVLSEVWERLQYFPEIKSTPLILISAIKKRVSRFT